MQLKLLSATAVPQDSSKIGVLFTDDKPVKSVPLQLPNQNSYTTHRSVTPILPPSESDMLHGYSEWKLYSTKDHSSELFSPMSTQFFVPLDYKAIFTGHQTLRVSESSQASLNEVSPVSPVFGGSFSAQVLAEASTKGESDHAEEFSPDFSRVLSELKKGISEFESDSKDIPKDLSKGQEFLQHSDSDLEFFDCRQVLSDSEPEDVKLENDINYHISESPCPVPGSSPNVLKGRPQYTAHPYLQVEDYKHFSSGSESLGDFAYDSESSWEFQTNSDLPVCEELPSRDHEGYCDDDDFLGRVRDRA